MNGGMHQSRANALGILGLHPSALGNSVVELGMCSLMIPFGVSIWACFWRTWQFSRAYIAWRKKWCRRGNSFKYCSWKHGPCFLRVIKGNDIKNMYPVPHASQQPCEGWWTLPFCFTWAPSFFGMSAPLQECSFMS